MSTGSEKTFFPPTFKGRMGNIFVLITKWRPIQNRGKCKLLNASKTLKIGALLIKLWLFRPIGLLCMYVESIRIYTIFEKKNFCF